MKLALPDILVMYRSVRLPKGLRYDWLKIAKACLFMTDRLCHKSAEFSEFEPIMLQRER